jgi:hypothetical protein
MTTQTAAASLKLHDITLGHVSHAAYHVSYTGKAPPGATLLLGLSNSDNAIDVTHKNPRRLIDEGNLGKSLSLIGNANRWGTKGRCRLFLKSGASVVPASDEAVFDCPIKPLVCRPRLRGPTLGISHSELMTLTYAAEDSHGAYGRYLHQPAIDGCTYFRNGRTGTLEVRDDMRGLVCTSYIGAVWGLSAIPNGPMTWTGAQIASCSGDPFFCQDVGVKDQSLSHVKDFLKHHPSETFLVGSKSHIVLAIRGMVHDFTTAPRSGYNCRSVDSWHPAAHVWTVGKPKVQF